MHRAERDLSGLHFDLVRESPPNAARFVQGSTNSVKQLPGSCEDGDLIRIDAERRRIDADIDWAARRAAFAPKPMRPAGGAYDKYRALVSSAAQGAVTIPTISNEGCRP